MIHQEQHYSHHPSLRIQRRPRHESRVDSSLVDGGGIFSDIRILLHHPLPTTNNNNNTQTTASSGMNHDHSYKAHSRNNHHGRTTTGGGDTSQDFPPTCYRY